MKDFSIEKLAEKVNKLKQQHQNISLKLRQASNELQEKCPHEHTIEEIEWFSGGYDYCAYSITNVKCCVCGKLLATDTKTYPGRYG